MRKKILFAIFLCSVSFLSHAVTRRVLFLGNSYTFVNNLPQLVSDVAGSVGDTLIFDSYTVGGYTLDQHSIDTIGKNKIMAGGWDYMVLQDQSQIPALEDYFSNGAINLCHLFRQYNPCGRAMFYMTWGRKNGDGLNCPVWPPVCTYEGMDSLLHLRYMEMALFNKSEVSPVGAVWKYVRENFPGIDLYQSDESHPSLAGSYLAACCFYTCIFKKDPSLITYNSTLSTIETTPIKQAAKIVAFDSLPDWDFTPLNPVADFSYTIGTGVNEVIFTNHSADSDSYLWDFGDGVTSTLKSPAHSYVSDGVYTITLTAINCDIDTTYQSTYQQNVSFCSYNLSIFPDSLLLCPGHQDTLWTQMYDSYQWLDMNGDTIVNETNQYIVPDGGSLYSVLVSQNNCTELSAPVYVEYFHPNAIYFVYTIDYMTPPDTACAGDTVTLVLSPNRPPYPIDSDIVWFKDGFPIPFSQNDTLEITSSGNYGVVLHNQVCPDYNLYENNQLPVTFINCVTGIPENNSVVVYPNPAIDLLNVKISSGLTGASYIICDMLGRILQQGKLETENNFLNMSSFSAGVYILKIDKIARRILKK